QSQRDAAVRRRPIVKGLEKKAEFYSGLFSGDAQKFKYFVLHLAPVDTDAAAADFAAVQNNVICLGPERCRKLPLIAAGGNDTADIIIHRRGEGMVNGDKTFFVFVPLQEGEINYPYKVEFLFYKIQTPAQFKPHSAEHIVDYFLLVSHKKHQITFA